MGNIFKLHGSTFINTEQKFMLNKNEILATINGQIWLFWETDFNRVKHDERFIWLSKFRNETDKIKSAVIEKGSAAAEEKIEKAVVKGNIAAVNEKIAAVKEKLAAGKESQS